ncbi:MAG TPA: FkbM family methyltransferase [Pyrinomonadaceae bacterium]|nr:FkbM family methyltransferase [Pyrinomonadaceae bacterium]
MPRSQGPVTGFLKKVLFRSAIKHPRLQRLWSRLHTLSVYAMNYGGGAFIESSGEAWVLSEVVRPAVAAIERPVIFDVGANVGDYSAMVHSFVPSARIYAFEPAAPVYEELARRLLVIGNGKSLEAFNFGFSDEEKTVDLYSYTVEGQSVSLVSSIDRRLPTQVLQVEVSDTERIQVRTLDSFCASQGIERIDFLKLDVEGHEVAVLRGSRGMLERGAISMIQFEFGPANIYSRTYFYNFWSMLSDRYDLFRIIPGGVVPITYYGEHLEVFLTTNYFARLKSAP